MQLPYVIAAQLYDSMGNICKAWYTNEDHIFPLTFKFTKEQMEKDKKKDQNMAQIMTQCETLSKKVMDMVLEVSIPQM